MTAAGLERAAKSLDATIPRWAQATEACLWAEPFFSGLHPWKERN